ncbi:hypothetical protein M407DRAFT_23906 [Tulasnella calospora MUT 4182]|uniref:Protein kinase domain-containing protein n=1 Tax=Tulasnella calospora MUT 4182 TaxID=1051891 RepID=A0A0C3QIT8_9AGAM|nr:hypothetical protein M407DRAFT_23906 [Tulasnella calospora MUT 4182]
MKVRKDEITLRQGVLGPNLSRSDPTKIHPARSITHFLTLTWRSRTMRRFASKILLSLRSFRLRIPTLKPRASTTEENAASGNDRKAHRDAITEFDEEATTKRPSVRERLDGLSSFRIDSNSINFASSDSRGSGGKGDVFRATYQRGDGSDDVVVAVKKVRIRYDQGVERNKFDNEFAHEVEVMAGLSHENIVRLIGFVEDIKNGTAWIVLSWEPNGNVSEFLQGGYWEIPERVSLVSDGAR